MAHATHKDFSLLPLRRMRLQDGSVSPQTSGNDGDNRHVIFLKLRAYFHSWAFVCLDIPDYFNLGAAERMVDKIFSLLYTKHAAGRPPPQFFSDAWDATARVLQDAVRSGKSLVTATEADGTYQHLWTVFVKEPSLTHPPGKQLHPQHPGTESGERGEWQARFVSLQRAKDQQIEALKREVEILSTPAPPDHAVKKGKWSKW